MNSEQLEQALQHAGHELWSTDYHEHFREPVDYALAKPGKLLRPRLLIASLIAAGGSSDDAICIAYAAEIAHVGSLVHDDIIDDDTLRRGALSVPAKYGAVQALLAGDALFFQLFKMLARTDNGLPDHVSRIVTAKFAELGLQLCAGEMLEHRATKQLDLDSNVSEQIASLKTASFFQCICEIGAILAGASHEQQSALSTYGKTIGIAFQALDDTLPYIESDSETGKPGLSDLRNSRPSYPVVRAFASASDEDRRIIRRLLTDTSIEIDERWRQLHKLVAQYRGTDQTVKFIRLQCETARTAVTTSNLPGSVDQLLAIIDQVEKRIDCTVSRDY
ncbi:polyprenyl synthetase family protein [Prescottella equi]